MRHGSLFSGIGGFDLAAEWMGWDNVFHCEINEFCQKVLKYYWPYATSYHDIKTTDFTVWRGKIDIISGGFPCQPYSQAGKRKGKADDRHLWPEMLRAIREIRPRWVVGENVPGLINWSGGMVLKEIKADMEAEGFEILATNIIPACAKDAPHKRDRLWIVAYSVNGGYKAGRGQEEETDGVQGIGGQTVDTGEFDRTNISSITPDTNSNTKGEIRGNNEKVCGLQDEKCGTENGSALLGGNGIENDGDATNANGYQRCEGRLHQGQQKETEQYISSLSSWNSGRTWENFPTQSPICSRDDGLSSELAGITFSKHRNESIKGYGNSIVPQVAYEIFKAIEHLNYIS